MPDRIKPNDRHHGERGAALIMAISAMTLLMVLAGALVTLTLTETAIAARQRNGLQAFYAAEAVVARTMRDLREAPDWEAVVAAASGAPYLEGPIGLVLGSSVPLAPLSQITVAAWVSSGDAGMVMIRGEARGPGGIRRLIETTVAREGHNLRVALWREGP